MLVKPPGIFVAAPSMGPSVVYVQAKDIATHLHEPFSLPVSATIYGIDVDVWHVPQDYRSTDIFGAFNKDDQISFTGIIRTASQDASFFREGVHLYDIKITCRDGRMIGLLGCSPQWRDEYNHHDNICVNIRNVICLPGYPILGNYALRING